MKKIFLIIILMLLTTNVYALNVEGINIDETVILNNVNLKLNGYGIRKKWFVKVYLSALYTTQRVNSFSQIMKDNTEKVIRLHFLHSKVEKNKVIESIREAFERITPDLLVSDAGKSFFNQFNADFYKGDVLELALLSDGSVITKHNNRVLGVIKSNRLAYGLLSIYVGDKPIDDDLKRGMLGER